MTELTGSDSKTATRFLRKPVAKGYKQLVKFYGVDVNLYRLINQSVPDNKLHGFLDDANNYERQPYFIGKVLIPSLFKRRNQTNLAALDPFVDADQYLYVPAGQEILLHTLVVCRLPSKRILNFRVTSISEIHNDAGLIVSRHSIVPVLSVDILRNTNEIKEGLKREQEAREQNKQNSWSTTEPNYNISGDFEYKPLS